MRISIMGSAKRLSKERMHIKMITRTSTVLTVFKNTEKPVHGFLKGSIRPNENTRSIKLHFNMSDP